LPECGGARLKKESLWFKLDNQNISEIARFDLNELDVWVKSLDKKLSKNQNIIAKDILKELQDRIGFLLNVGLNYLSSIVQPVPCLAVNRSAFVWLHKSVPSCKASRIF
jgi:excinuclease UvrABC ATPase subunit